MMNYELGLKNDSILCVTNDYFYSYSAFSLF